MELPFAVESPERTSPLLPESSTGDDGMDDDGSSLVTTSSQGSFLGSSSGTSGFVSHHLHNPRVIHTATPLTGTSAPAGSQHTANIHPTSPPPTMRPSSTTHTAMMSRAHPNTHAPRDANRLPAPVVAVLPPAPPPPRSSGSGGITSGLNIFGNLRVPSIPSAFQSSRSRVSKKPQAATTSKQNVETVDFTYVNVCDTDADEVDITLDGQYTAMDGLHGALGEEENNPELSRGDILTVLLSGAAQGENSDNEVLVSTCEEANEASNRAMTSKKEGNLQGALDAHAQAAKQFREAALLIKDRNMSMANSLLLLSKTQAKSALALKRILKQQPSPYDNNTADPKNPRSKILTQKDRLRAAVRGALVTRNEEEMSDSAFLGRANKGPYTSASQVEDAPNTKSGARPSASPAASETSASINSSSGAQHNPVDDMMELERELKDMDMALELGNSIASLDARTQNRLKNSSIGVDGSFMVVPPGSQSYMSSSNMWSPATGASNPVNSSASANASSRGSGKQRANTAPRARANRVQNILEASSQHPRSTSQAQVGHPQQQLAPHSQQQQHIPGANPRAHAVAPPPAGLESSWWGSSSTTSQVLTSSVISLGASSFRGGIGGDGVGGSSDANSSANTKQLMRLMDALKTLTEENADLLRKAEEAEASRMEAKAAKEQMAKFKAEYGKRFSHLRAALDKFRRENTDNTGGNGEPNPVVNSEFMRSASTTEQIQRQEQLIRKLTADLKKEKEESKKKDQALRKYESFYKEVKARSAQKAAQRQREAAVQGHHRPPQAQGRKPGHR